MIRILFLRFLSFLVVPRISAFIPPILSFCSRRRIYFLPSSILKEGVLKINVVILSVSEESHIFLFKSKNQKRDPSDFVLRMTKKRKLTLYIHYTASGNFRASLLLLTYLPSKYHSRQFFLFCIYWIKLF